MITRHAYLTIDDTPNALSDVFLDALQKRNVPAIIFCRGDMMDLYPDTVVRAIRNGFVIGNHGYHHTRATKLGFEAACDNIMRADALIENAYRNAGVARPGKYYRFAYMDRGMGAWFVEPASVPAQHYDYVSSMISTGLGNNPLDLPDTKQIETKNALQAFLKANGYSKVPFRNINHAFYAQSEMANAVDAMFTFSTADWAMTERHRDKGIDVKGLVDNDPHLARTDTSHIVLAHDQAEIHDVTIALVDHMISKGFKFEALHP